MIRNIIFDWSGTLSDDLSCTYSTVNNVFKKIGLKKIGLEEFKKEFTLPYMDFYSKYCTTPKYVIDQIYFEEISKVNPPQPYNGTKRCLILLKGLKLRLSILSSHPEEKLKSEIHKFGFNDYFIDVIGGIHNKEEAVLKIINNNDFKRKETIFIGDMTHDIIAGKKAKILTMAVTWGYEVYNKLKHANPDFIVSKFSELMDTIRNHESE